MAGPPTGLAFEHPSYDNSEIDTAGGQPLVAPYARQHGRTSTESRMRFARVKR